MSIRRALSIIAASCTLSFAMSASAGPPASKYVESDKLPVRVYFDSSVSDASIAKVLALAEEAWETQVEQMGFTPPSVMDEDGKAVQGLWIHLDPNLDYDRGVAEADNPGTSWTDCTAYVQIVTLSPSSYLETLVPHEANHVLQMADDCGESAFAYEQTTVAVTTLGNPSEFVFTGYALPAFQSAPHEGLACTFFYNAELRYYHYGSSLFQLFLEDRYGDYDGKLLANIWKAARQDGTVTNISMMGPTMSVPNEPDLLAAIATAIAPVTLQEAYVEFARWRYFVGANDDGAHFRDGASWTGGEVALAGAHAVEDLPLTTVPGQTDVDELGAAYVEVDVTTLPQDHGLRLTFQGGADALWNVDVLLIPKVGSATVQALDVGEDGLLEADLAGLSEYERVVLVMSNLGDGDYDGEVPECASGSTFSYQLENIDVAVPPTIASVDPAEITVGTEEYLWVFGTGFSEGTIVQISGSDIDVSAADFIDDGTLGATVTVGAGAEPGPRDVTVLHPNGKEATLSGALTVKGVEVDAGAGGGGQDAGGDPITPEEETDEGDEGCSCRTVAGSSDVGWAWAGLGVLMLGLRRRRRG